MSVFLQFLSNAPAAGMFFGIMRGIGRAVFAPCPVGDKL